MNSFKARLSKKLRQAVQEVIRDAQSDPTGYVEALVNETVNDIKRSHREAVMYALGVDARWHRCELQRGGLLERALDRGRAVTKLADAIEELGGNIVLTPKEKKDLLGAAREKYLEELERRVKERAEERVRLLADEHLDAMIDEVLSGKEPSR